MLRDYIFIFPDLFGSHQIDLVINKVHPCFYTFAIEDFFKFGFILDAEKIISNKTV
jgi:hypothetical protein